MSGTKIEDAEDFNRRKLPMMKNLRKIMRGGAGTVFDGGCDYLDRRDTNGNTP